MSWDPPSLGTIHGACGWAAAPGNTKGTPPSGRAIAATQAAAPATIGSAGAPAAASTSIACRAAVGSLPGVRTSGSRACPKPPSALR
ncbi:hypothetical protein CcI49_32750 [Frankia sp. CcI49]|nr:hypothetical protein CcI49_32750 [Frankia sp. CcI49]